MRRLDLSSAPVLTSAEIATLSTAEELLEYASTVCATKFGVGMYSKPENRPRDLSTITDPDALTDSELGMLHAQYTGWAAYYNTQLARIRAAKDIADGRSKKIAAQESLVLFKKGVPKAEVPMHIQADVLYQESQLEALKLQAMRLIIEAEYKVFDKQAASISRLITLRSEDRQQQYRGSGVANMRRERKTRAPRTTRDVIPTHRSEDGDGDDDY